MPEADSQINAEVRSQLGSDLELAAAYFDVATREGVVTLTGWAKTSRWKLTAKTR